MNAVPMLGCSLSEPRSCPSPPASRTPLGYYSALRKEWGKTVMTLRGPLRAPSADRQPDATAPDSTTEDRQALDELFSLAYEELRRLASSVKRGDPSVTLSSTALVNEAWLKLVKSPGIKAASHLHFKRIAARAMRQLLVEAARRRNSRKRGGSGNVFFVSFDESFHGGVPGKGTLLALDMALTELARLAPRQAQIVEYRFFGGLEIAEISNILNLSEATVLRDWRAAKAWMGHALGGNDSSSDAHTGRKHKEL